MAKRITENGKSGFVFFDEVWDAWGWSTTDVAANGPFDTAEAAEEALREELGSERKTKLPVGTAPVEVDIASRAAQYFYERSNARG